MCVCMLARFFLSGFMALLVRSAAAAAVDSLKKKIVYQPVRLLGFFGFVYIITCKFLYTHIYIFKM